MTAAGSSPEAAGWRRPPATPGQVRADVFGSIGLFLVSVLSIVLTRAIGLYGEAAADPAVSVIMMAAITLPLARRRRQPIAVAIVVSIVFIAGGELVVEESIVRNIALFCAIYTVGAWEPDHHRATVTRIGAMIAMGIWLIVDMFRIATIDLGTDGPGIGALTPNVGLMLQNLLVNVLYFAGAYWFGEHARNAARHRAVLQERTAQLAVEQARLAQQAVTIERLRIARELHDAVAHHVSLMGVQAAAARSVLPRDVDGAQAQLSILEDSARAAISELYALLGTLRDPDIPPDDSGAEASVLDLAGLPALAGESAAAGLEVAVSTVGEPYEVPPLIGLNLYRIAQESLTNVRKHAGDGTRVAVRVRYLSGVIELEITDDGAGRARAGGQGLGLGLPGMRERVGSLRGELTVGPRSSGGYLVRARIPLAVPTPPESSGMPQRQAVR